MDNIDTEPEYHENISGVLIVTTEGPMLGTELHLLNGRFHCEDGPAVIYPDRSEWWLNGEMVFMSFGVANCFEEVCCD